MTRYTRRAARSRNTRCKNQKQTATKKENATHETRPPCVHRYEQGYRCLVPDLYKGKLGVNVEEAHHLMSNLDWPGAKGEIARHPRLRRLHRSCCVTSFFYETLSSPSSLLVFIRVDFPHTNSLRLFPPAVHQSNPTNTQVRYARRPSISSRRDRPKSAPSGSAW